MLGPYTNYVESSPTAAFIDACALPGHTNILPGEDDRTAAVTLPFAFRFYDVLGTSAWVSSNGVIGFGSSATTNRFDACLPSSGGPRNAIFAFWDDLVLGPNGVCLGTVGAAPNRVQVFTWSGATRFSDSSAMITYSVVLTEGSNVVDIVYQTLSGGLSNGSSATVGVQDTTATRATMHSCSMPVLTSGTAIRYTPM
jgi:hypothetical protein